MNSRILETVEEYERYSPLYDDEAEYYFMTMFENPETAVVFCDLMGMPSYMDEISVQDYIDLVKQQSQNTVVAIKDVSKGEYTFRDGKWYVPVAFRKSISYIDQGGYVFSAEEYFGADYQIRMQLCYDPEADRCLVCSIKGELDSQKVFPKERFKIVDKASELDKKSARYMESLTVDGQPLDYNQFGQAIVSQGEFATYDPDVDVIVDNGYQGFNYDVVSFRFDPRNTRLQLRYGYAPVSAYSVKRDGKISENISDESSAMEVGADLGFAFQVGTKSKMSFNFGAGISLSELNLNYALAKPYTYSYTYVSGVSNGMLTTGRVDYSIASATESVKYMDLMVPIYFELEHNINKWLMISWNFGVKGYLPLQTNLVTPYTLVGTTSVDGQKSTQLVLASKDERPLFVAPNTYDKNIFELSAMANLGADFSLYKRMIYATLRVGYEYGILSSYDSDLRPYDKSRPVVYHAAEGNHVAVNSLISGMSFRRNALWISLGFKFKL